MMYAVRWLPVGRVAHGYRRVFVVEEQGKPTWVFSFVPMPYEIVYNLRERGKPHVVSDPSLWWGLALCRQLLLRRGGVERRVTDQYNDGFLQMRPDVPPDHYFLSADEFERVAKSGVYVIDVESSLREEGDVYGAG